MCATLRAHGYEAVLAGGCVRDVILGHDPSDYDVATNARPHEIQTIFPVTEAVGIEFGVILVITQKRAIEVATFRSDGPYTDGRHPDTVSFTTLEEDAQRRDFTINGMYMDPADGSIIDLVGGREDLESGCIRAIGNPAKRFEEDKLRMLRAVRFSARFGFPIDPETKDAIRAGADTILSTSAERIRAELNKMLTEGHSETAFRLLDETGLLKAILPEVHAMHGIEQPPNYHPEGDVFQHTMLLLRNFDARDDREVTLAWGALLHDVGKPPTQTFEDRIRFNQHDTIGADMANAICKRLRMPNAQRERIVWLVRTHMRPAIAVDMRENKKKRFVREDGFDELMELAELDAHSSHGDSGFVDELRAYRNELPPEKLRPPAILSGNDLIDLGYTPGPRFREILQSVEDQQLEGAMSSRDEAIAYVQENFPL